MARIAVIGSVSGDEMILLDRPLTAGAHLNGKRTGLRLGGGGANTAVALAAAEHRVSLLSAVGHDAVADALLRELEVAGVFTDQIVRLDQPTTRSIVMVDPAGERSVVNLSRCEEEQPPLRLLDLAADAVYVRSRRNELAALLARIAAAALVVALAPCSIPMCTSTAWSSRGFSNNWANNWGPGFLLPACPICRHHE